MASEARGFYLLLAGDRGGGAVGEGAEGGGDGERGEEARGAEEPAEGRGGWGDEGLLRAEEAEEGWTAA